MMMRTIYGMQATTLALAALLAGCASPPPVPAPKSYVVLLPDADGHVGKVFVQGALGKQLIEKPQQAAFMDGSATVFDVDAVRLQRDFGAAMAARPPLAEHFLLYFETGGTELTAESKALMPRIVERARVRASVDMSVIGHSDTQGAAQANEVLSYKRASAIADQLRRMGLADTTMAIESHGERNLLIPTPDETPEPGNRRVEITLR